MRRHREAGQIDGVMRGGEAGVARIEAHRRCDTPLRARSSRREYRRAAANWRRSVPTSAPDAVGWRPARRQIRLSLVDSRTARASGVPAVAKNCEFLAISCTRLPMPVKLDDVRTQHRAAKRIAVADAVRPVDLQEERLVELVRLDLQPDFLVLAVQM